MNNWRFCSHFKQFLADYGNFRWFLVISNFWGTFKKIIIKVWGQYLNQLPIYGRQLFFKQFPAVLGHFSAFLSNYGHFTLFLVIFQTKYTKYEVSIWIQYNEMNLYSFFQLFWAISGHFRPFYFEVLIIFLQFQLDLSGGSLVIAGEIHDGRTGGRMDRHTDGQD